MGKIRSAKKKKSMEDDFSRTDKQDLSVGKKDSKEFGGQSDDEKVV